MKAVAIERPVFKINNLDEINKDNFPELYKGSRKKRCSIPSSVRFAFFEMKCETCGRTFTKQYRAIINNGQLCMPCSKKLQNHGIYPNNQIKTKQTCLEKYGVTNIFKSKQIQEKIKQTNLNRYGSEQILKSKIIQDKIKATNINKYGVDNPIKSDLIKEKIKKSNLERLGVEWPCQSKIIRKKQVESWKLRSDIHIKKALETRLLRYGYKYPEVIEKSRQTRLSKYRGWGQNSEKAIKTKIKKETLNKTRTNKSFLFNDHLFDSSWELYFYIYLLLSEIKFKYKPEPIEYSDNNGKTHFYFPDFLVDDTIIEIKGDHLLKDGKLWNPYKKCFLTEKQALFDAIGVVIISIKDLSSIIKYLNLKFGKNFTNQYKLNKKESKNETK